MFFIVPRNVVAAGSYGLINGTTPLCFKCPEGLLCLLCFCPELLCAGAVCDTIGLQFNQLATEAGWWRPNDTGTPGKHTIMFVARWLAVFSFRLFVLCWLV